MSVKKSRLYSRDMPGIWTVTVSMSACPAAASGRLEAQAVREAVIRKSAAVLRKRESIFLVCFISCSFPVIISDFRNREAVGGTVTDFHVVLYIMVDIIFIIL